LVVVLVGAKFFFEATLSSDEEKTALALQSFNPLARR
jgi:hypothetical protein